MILSLTVHECAHAGCAYLLGDRTAKDAGRLTLNPQAHIDPWGTLFIPALGVIMGGIPFLGWARPAPFNASRIREGVNRRLASVLVALAGPMSHVALALLAISLLAALGKVGFPLYTVDLDGDVVGARRGPIAVFLLAMYEMNLGLAFFHLLPIPPLDGYRLLPRALDPIVRPLERYGFAILMVAFLMLPPGILGAVFRPVFFVIDKGEAVFGVG